MPSGMFGISNESATIHSTKEVTDEIIGLPAPDDFGVPEMRRDFQRNRRRWIGSKRI